MAQIYDSDIEIMSTPLPPLPQGADHQSLCFKSTYPIKVAVFKAVQFFLNASYASFLL